MPEKDGSVTGNRGRQRQQMTTIPVLLHLIFVVLIRRASTQMVAMNVTVDLGTRKRLLITVFLVQVKNYYLPHLDYSAINVFRIRIMALKANFQQYFSYIVAVRSIR
jgi:hypothetical protein